MARALHIGILFGLTILAAHAWYLWFAANEAYTDKVIEACSPYTGARLTSCLRHDGLVQLK